MTFRHRFFREPLVWFLCLGALIFILDQTVNRDAAREIHIDQSLRERLSVTWEASYGRTPTAPEMRSLIDDHIVEEMLYREALALGLDDGDQIIRRRLTQKVRFLSEDAMLDQIPTEAVLREWFDTRAADYREPARVSFSHVYINPSAHANGDEDALVARLDAIEAALIAGRSAEGDVFLLPLRYAHAPLARVSGDLGQAFADELLRLPTRSWAGPIASSHGLHFVFIESRSDPLLPTFEQARANIERDYQAEQRQQAYLDFVQDLRSKYQIVEDIIDGGEAHTP